MASRWIHSREGIVVIELETNYNWWLSEENLDEAIGVIKGHFNLPEDAKPKWYLEAGIELIEEPEEYLLQSKSPVSYDDAVKVLTALQT
jgi:hypothetical protein